MNENDAYKRITKEITRLESTIIDELTEAYITNGEASCVLYFDGSRLRYAMTSVESPEDLFEDVYHDLGEIN